MTNKLTTGFMGLFLLLVVVDMGLTYYGVKYLGMVEGSFIIGKAGLTSGNNHYSCPVFLYSLFTLEVKELQSIQGSFSCGACSNVWNRNGNFNPQSNIDYIDVTL